MKTRLLSILLLSLSILTTSGLLADCPVNLEETAAENVQDKTATAQEPETTEVVATETEIELDEQS